MPVPAEPLLPQRCQEGHEQRGAKGRIKYGLGLTDSRIGSGPARGGDRLTRRDIPNGRVEKELQEGVIHFVVVRLEL